MVNTEHKTIESYFTGHYNILNIVVNTEPSMVSLQMIRHYNILNIVVNTEQKQQLHL